MREVIIAGVGQTPVGEHWEISLRSLAHRLVRSCDGNIVLFVDYLQKVSVEPIKTVDENDKVTIIVEGLKDLAQSGKRL